MTISILNQQQQERYYNDILEMLIAGDAEFLPPLSARSSTTQADLSGKEKASCGVLSYFKALKQQRLMVACEDGKLLAFVSFKENFTNEHITDADLPNIYISTLIVKPEGRGKGLTKTMYKALFEAYAYANTFTRTWSTNVAHMKILSSFGFDTLKVLQNDRGEGIDTVYFKKPAVR